MHLMDVKRMNLMRFIHNSPMLIRTHADTRHGRVLGTISLAVNIETLFIFCEGDRKIRRGLFERRERCVRDRHEYGPLHARGSRASGGGGPFFIQEGRGGPTLDWVGVRGRIEE